MRVKKLSVTEACAILSALGCEQDPIFTLGDSFLDTGNPSNETTPSEIEYCAVSNDDLTDSAGKIRIQYYATGGRLKSGSLYSMVVDRLSR